MEFADDSPRFSAVSDKLQFVVVAGLYVDKLKFVGHLKALDIDQAGWV